MATLKSGFIRKTEVGEDVGRTASIKDKREFRVQVFEDTKSWYENSRLLQEAVRKSIAATKFYPEDAEIKAPRRFAEPITVRVTKSKSMQAAYDLKAIEPGVKVCVHNFASATHPGGGIAWGSTAQEECLCRCTTLFPCLGTAKLFHEYYKFHRDRSDANYTGAIIYTPGVLGIKTDTDAPQRLPEDKWIETDIVTCAAPNLRAGKGSQSPVKAFAPDGLFDIHLERAKRIIAAAADNGADVLITGAFGCGAFKNPPLIVARAWKKAIEESAGLLGSIEFAVYCTLRDESNYAAFSEILLK